MKFTASGVELIIQNSTFQFGKDAKVVVEQGATLTLDNATFTYLDTCPAMWQGVQVWGTRDSSQYATDPNGRLFQGKLVLTEASRIKHARTAVSLWEPGNYNTTGGIVQATDAFFENNGRSVHALYYKNSLGAPFSKEMDNLSYFNNCSFDINPSYIPDYDFYKHADLVKVRGIKFMGCDFSVVNTPGVATWTNAIASYSAGFSVRGKCISQGVPCSQYDRNTFTGFYHAVYATNDGTNNYTFSISRSDFVNNECGVYMTDVHNAAIFLNDFEIAYKNVAAQPQAFGIDLWHSTGFAIEENHFTKMAGAPTANYVGIRIGETQSTEQVYKNYFEGLSYGNYAVGKNWEDDYFEGLAYYCNDNTANFADFYVEPDGDPFKYSGIQSKQGDDDYVAGNKFTPSGATWHFYNGGDYLVGYYFCDFCNNENPDDFKEFQVTDKPKSFDNDCPSHYGGGGGGGTGRGLVLTPGEKQEAEMEFAANLADYNNVKTLYDNLKDGGNTEATITDIETSWPDDMWELRAELLGKSPHLSMDVLKATADKTDVLPDNVIFEIMAANPDELKKEELIKYLEDKANPLPEYMVNILRQVAEGSTYKTVLEQEMAHYNQVKTRAAYDIIRSILNDTVTDVAELRTWLGKLGGKRADEQVIASYMEEENYSQALSLANALPQTYDYDENELIEHGYYMDMLNLMNTLNQQGRTVFELDSTEVSNLVYIAENTKGTASAQAKGILEYAYGYHFCDCINSDSTGYKSSGSFNPGNYGQAYGISLTVSPNPATDWVAFDYSLNDDNASASIKITDITGKPITVIPVTGRQGQKIWDTRKVSPGVYFYNFNTSGANKSGKIIVRK